MTYLTLVQIDDGLISQVSGKDKIAHFIFYFVMSILALNTFNNPSVKIYILIFVLVAAYGFLLENIQLRMNLGRHFEFFDIIANIIGSLTGSVLVYFINKRLN